MSGGGRGRVRTIRHMVRKETTQHSNFRFLPTSVWFRCGLGGSSVWFLFCSLSLLVPRENLSSPSPSISVSVFNSIFLLPLRRRRAMPWPGPSLAWKIPLVASPVPRNYTSVWFWFGTSKSTAPILNFVISFSLQQNFLKLHFFLFFFFIPWTLFSSFHVCHPLF